MITFNQIHYIRFFLTICSAALILAALYFQYVLDLVPCKLCIWQRVPHIVVVGTSVLVLFQPMLQVLTSSFALISTFIGTILAGYHAGIEAKLWPGPQNCSGGINLEQISPELFLQELLTKRIVRCDEVPWSFLNVSMAGWNFIISLILTLIWVRLVLLILKSSNFAKH